jgi:hypothetical protein
MMKTKMNIVRFGAVLLPLLLSQSYAFAATRDHGAAAPQKSVVMHVMQPAFRATPDEAIMLTPGTTARAVRDMSDMWPYYLDLG